MRTYLTLLIFSCVMIFAGCEKDATVTDANLEGTWELRHALGIQISGMSPDFPPGNGRVVKFEESNYQIYDKGTLVFSSTYRIESDKKEIDGTDYSSKIVYQNSGREMSSHIKISGNTLKISSGTRAADGATETFKKQ